MNILISVDSIDHFYFFKKIVSNTNNLNIFYISNKISLKIFEKKINIIRPSDKRKMFKEKFKKSKEYSLNLGGRLVSDCYYSTREKLIYINKKNKIDLVFIWNGNSIIDIAISDFAYLNKIKVLYFENANIKGKVFVDKLGTNAQSEIFVNKSHLNNFRLNKDFSSWKKNYLREKLNNHVVPQSTGVKRINYFYIFDLIGYLLKISIRNENYNFYNKIKSKLSSKINSKFQSIYPLNFDYIFYPMQVASDTQMLLNSKYNNKDVISIAMRDLKKDQFLLVKPHPAEPDSSVNKYLQRINKIHNVFVVENNTFELIRHANIIYTINSTVGLEAKLYDKPIKTFGDAIYSNFDDNDLNRYISSYLVSEDIFSHELKNKSVFDDLVKRTL
jgi:capsular polysaccharide export protein